MTFTVVAENADSYQWQIDRNDGKGFVALNDTWLWKGTKTASFSFVLDASRENIPFRVVVTNAQGSVTSEAVKATIATTINGVTYKSTSSTTCKVVSYDGTVSSLTIPETVDGMTVTEIGEEAFMGNTYLTSIDLPDTVEVIRARAFMGCTNLSSMS